MLTHSLRENRGMLEEGTRRPAVLRGLVVSAVVVAASWPLARRGIVPLDEGQVASFANRILGGEVLYRDMYSGIYPGIYYLTALLFKLFGVDLWVTRVAAVVVNVVTALCLWRLGVRALSAGWALVAPVLYALLVVWSFPIMTMLAYSAVSLMFGLWALLFAFRYAERARTIDGVVAGLMLAACALTKQNYGLLAGAAVLYAIVDAARARGVGALAPVGIVRALVPVVLAGGVVSAAAFASIWAAGAWPRFWQYTVTTITSSQLEAFDQPIPPIFGPHPQNDGRFIFLYTPGVLFSYLIRGETLLGLSISPLLRSTVIRLAYGGVLALLMVAPLVLLLGRQTLGAAERAAARRVNVAAVLLFLGLFPSAIWSHLTAVLAPVLLLASIVAARVVGAIGRRAPRLARGMVGASLAAGLIATLATAQVIADFRRWNDTPVGRERASILVSTADAALLDGAVGFLERCAAPGEPIFVAPDLPLVYFLTERPNPTPYEMTIPGDVDSDLLIARLEESRTRCVVYNPKMYVHFDPLEKVFPKVAAYVNEHFQLFATIRADGREWYGLVRRSEEAS